MFHFSTETWELDGVSSSDSFNGSVFVPNEESLFLLAEFLTLVLGSPDYLSVSLSKGPRPDPGLVP